MMPPASQVVLVLGSLPESATAQQQNLGFIYCESSTEASHHLEGRSWDAVLVPVGTVGVDHDWRYQLLANMRAALLGTPLLVLLPDRPRSAPVISAAAWLEVGAELLPVDPLDGATIRELLRSVLARNAAGPRIRPFLYNPLVEYLVHDLKTPIATLLTNLHFVEQHITSKLGHSLVEEGVHIARRLERMVLDLLDVGRSGRGALALEPVTVLLEDLVEEAVVAVRPLARSHEVTLEVALGELAPATVDVDFDLMTRVLINLFENAVRYSPAGTTVLIHTRATSVANRLFTLFIDDEGMGIPEDWRVRIFDKFARRDTGRRVGQGLGLAFAKLVAEAHGIEIGIGDKATPGTRFLLRWGAAEATPTPK